MYGSKVKQAICSFLAYEQAMLIIAVRSTSFTELLPWDGRREWTRLLSDSDLRIESIAFPFFFWENSSRLLKNPWRIYGNDIFTVPTWMVDFWW